jgi:putative membrane-bound dehydrogenase-like protein
MVRLSALLIAVTTTAPLRSAEMELNGRLFRLPDGFQLELVAAPPLVDRPICADLDEEGRLYVADSSGSNDNVNQQLQERPHRIVRLEDTNGDGSLDKRVVFADQMMFPEGALWFDGSLYVAAPPSIWKLTDTNGDGVADERHEWFSGKTLTGCANDLHGPYRGPDGWLYWCKGAFAKQTYERPGKPPLVTRAAHIFRRHPNGGPVEPVMTGGMDNPVEVVFTPGGERIFTTTFLQHPGGGRRDGLIHAIYGGVYGKIHDVIDEHPRTGDVLPVLTHLGAAAPCGLARLESDQLGPEFQNNLVACLFNMHKLTRHVLQPLGATFKTQDEDLLFSEDIDFHPTDVIEDADGSLLVIDTGGWYKLCCPTSQLWKPDVLGAIYRLRRAGSHQVDDPRGKQLDWDTASVVELAERMQDRRPAVRRRAADLLAARGDQAVSALARLAGHPTNVQARLGAVWTLTRISGSQARAAVRSALADPVDEVRQAAIHSVSLWRDREAKDALSKLLGNGSPHNRRAAAEAIGRTGHSTAVAQLLAAAGAEHDRVLGHSLCFALIEIADPAATELGLTSSDARTRCRALIALDQMGESHLAADKIEPLLASQDPLLRETARWIVQRHPEWGPGLVGFFHDQIRASGLGEAEMAELEGLLVRFARHDAIFQVMVAGLRDESVSRTTKQAILRGMARSGVKTMPASWAKELNRILAMPDDPLAPDAIAAVRALPAAELLAGPLTSSLLRNARNPNHPPELRLEALAAVPGGLAQVEPHVFEFLCLHLSAEHPVRSRSFAADALARATLNPDQLNALMNTLASVGPMELDCLLGAFEQRPDEQMGLKLLHALERSPAAAALRIDEVKARFAKFGDRVGQEAERLTMALEANAEQQKAQLDQLAASLAEGDVRRGQQVFNSSKAACAACHAIGYLGGDVGPDLTRIGRIRTQRDLLEAIVFPNASFVRSYEPYVVVTTGGQVLSGVLRSNASDEVVLAIDAEKQVRVPRDQIDEMRPGTVSVMPAALDKQLTLEELADLLAFLMAAQ